jgi:hypothetical protein
MYSVQESTVKGLNAFIEKQKEANVDGSLKLIQFYSDWISSMNYEVVRDAPLSVITPLARHDFLPWGNTPLYDAQARAIKELGEELEALPEVDRPNKVMFVTITDGFNNASYSYTRENIATMIKHQTDKYNWDCIYLGANQDAVEVGQTMSFKRDKAMSFATSDGAINSTFGGLANYAIRSSNLASSNISEGNRFSDEERSGAIGSSLAGVNGDSSLPGVNK